MHEGGVDYVKKAIYVLSDHAFANIYGPDQQAAITDNVSVLGQFDAARVVTERELLAEVEFIFSGWGAPTMDAEFLAKTPKLEMVFYGAGSIKNMVTDAFWQRGIRVTSAYAANAIPVAEYTLSQILFCLKRGWHYALTTRQDGAYPKKVPVPGGFRSTVGIISLGMIGRLVCHLLKPFDLNVIAYDPYANEETAAELCVELCSLDQIFNRSDVVSLHTPWLRETEGMIRGHHFEQMRENGSFINTARGAVVNEDEMINVLRQRPDLQAVLDVTHPEPPRPGSPLYSLNNVVLTPHIAGAQDHECRRMGQYMVDELKRYLSGQPLAWEIHEQQAKTLA